MSRAVFLMFCFWVHCLAITGCAQTSTQEAYFESHPVFLTHLANPAEIMMFYADESDQLYRSFGNLKSSLEDTDQQLIFAMNGGMFEPDFSPVGLYVEEGETLFTLNQKRQRKGNFYLLPNGVFVLYNDGTAACMTTKNYSSENVRYATQSGPMLVIDGELHTAFNADSKNLNIRNGVGVLPDGRLLFAISREKINFHSFATFFLDAGCQNALYLDGFVSRTYLPAKNETDEGGNFGVIIAQLSEN